MIDTQNLPKDGPVLLNLNHPGGFIDACVISAYSSRPLFYLTRGDFFKKGIVTWFLNVTHQIPIFRAEDGMKNLRNNRQTFSRCFETLAEDKVLLIFPESWAIPEKKLRTLHNGAARIMFGTHEEYPDLSPVMVPVGVTFTDASLFGRDVFIRYGKPISVEKHMALYHEDPKKAYTVVMKEIELALRSLMILLDTDEKELLFDDAIILMETPIPELPAVSHSPVALEWQISIANHVNALDDEELNTLKHHIDAIKSVLKKVDLPFHIYPFLEDRRVSLFWMILTAPLNFVGKIIEALPVWFTYRYVVNDIKQKVFIGPMKSMVGIFIHAFYYIIVTIILAIFLGSIGWLVGGSVALLGYFSLNQHRRPNLLHWLRWMRISNDEKDVLKGHRSHVVEMLSPPE
jgi:glycerol-3-phosphate O-acyltransferase / dihydroxyacetone phosphate acyltransferase